MRASFVISNSFLVPVFWVFFFNTLWGPCFRASFNIFNLWLFVCMFRCFQAVHRTFDLLMLFVSMMVFYFAIWMWCLLYIYIFFVKRCDF